MPVLTADFRSPRAALIAVLLCAAPLPAQEATTVGMPGRLEGVVLPGPELRVKRLEDRKTAVVLRIVRVYPHGTAFRYDFEYAGLEPGPHDLRDYLELPDGKPASHLPPIPVQVRPVLPPGQVEPNRLQVEPGPRVGGYRITLIVLGTLWGLGLAAIVASFFFPRRRRAAVAADAPVSLADRLRPLVEGAIAGKLSRGELADLERGLLAYWRRRLRLEAVPPAEAIDTMRRHPEAGPLLSQLEAWLHRPGPPAAVDVGRLLAPYRNLPPDAVELAGDDSRKAVAV